MTEAPYHVYFRVKNDLEQSNQGYEWFVDSARCGGLMQTIMSNPIFALDGTGTQIIQLYAFGLGACNYRLAYARSNIFIDSNHTANSTVSLDDTVALVIEIPIRIE